ncbi:MAG: enoyl-[acyl-carrier-protein] reductase FabK [Chloroflexi bacterium]|nr:enoyl-[acyl-carrier-protein] reductase FabK [Chloroflexota bacterium]
MTVRTALCDLLDIKYPIIQGGMAWLGTYELAAAVSNAGGLGIIGAGNATGDWVQGQIRKMKELTEKPFGVNIMLLSPYAHEVIEVVLKEWVPVVTTGAGNPGTLIPQFKMVGIKMLPLVSAVALARRLERLGADGLVAEGMESGGHIGDTTTMALVPQVVDATSLPVVAAGGIADGRGLVAALALGAQGVQMGTRFVCAEECIAHPNFKARILEARDRATVASGHSTGHPVRALENRMTRQFMAMEKVGATPEELEQFGTGKLRLGAIEGDMENGSLMAGQIAGLIKDIKSVRDIIEDIVAEAEILLGHLATMAKEVVPYGR